MSSRRTFVDRVLNGEVLDLSEIDDEVDAWHSSESNTSLGEWLGMTRDEYSLYVERSSSLPLILHARKYQLDLRSFLAQTESSTALAARGSSAQEVNELLEWLRETGRL